jgi:hypothetical protein
MNMISQLRQRVSQNGEATLTLEEFNQLQAEWIIRAQIEVSESCPVYALPSSAGKPVTRQQSGTEYQVRINGKQLCDSPSLDNEMLDSFANACAEKPEDYVDIVSVRTEILMSQYNYRQMQLHFVKT